MYHFGIKHAMEERFHAGLGLRDWIEIGTASYVISILYGLSKVYAGSFYIMGIYKVEEQYNLLIISTNNAFKGIVGARLRQYRFYYFIDISDLEGST